MAKNGFKILDSDMHVMEPPDLWERYIDSKFKARAPRGVTSSNVRDLRMVYPDGRDWARTTTRQNDSARGHNFERNQAIYRSDAERGWTPEVQLEAMDTEGIDVAVLIQHAGCARWWSKTWMPSLPRRLRALTTIGSMIFAVRILHA
jgi:hypothetical protein